MFKMTKKKIMWLQKRPRNALFCLKKCYDAANFLSNASSLINIYCVCVCVYAYVNVMHNI